jgi:hypothetical protein
LSNFNLVVIVRNGFTSDAGEARKPCLSGADNPNRRTTLTSDALPVGVDCVLEPPYQICTVGSGIRTQMKFDVLMKAYRRKFVIHFCHDNILRVQRARTSNQIGSCSRLSNSLIERPCPGFRSMNPCFSRLKVIWCIEGGETLNNAVSLPPTESGHVSSSSNR